MNYIKLQDGLVFTVISVNGFVFKHWSPELKKMETSPTWKDGFQKRWAVTTDKGELELSISQIGSMLEACLKGNGADITGNTFKVKTNGKTGIEIRYWINRVFNKPAPEDEIIVRDEDPIGDMPF